MRKFARLFFLTMIRRSLAEQRRARNLWLLPVVILAGISFGQAQIATNPPMLITEARVVFLQPAGKTALLFQRNGGSKSKWILQQTFPTNDASSDQFVFFKLSNPQTNTAIKVEFR